MKKRRTLLPAIALGLMLTACGDFREAPGTAPGSDAGTNQQESPEAKELPASQEYVSSDGSYQAILPEGLTQTDTTILAGSDMMMLDGGSDRKGFGAFCVKSSKSNVYGSPDAIESLADYADHMTDLLMNGSGVTADWEDVDAPSAEGAVSCLARKSVVTQGASRGLAYGYYLETASNYYSVFLIGNTDDVEEAMQVIALEILEEASGQGGTRNFLNGMTAVLDSLNGASVRETYYMLEEGGADESQLEIIASQSRQSLSSSWGIESGADLTEMADTLIAGRHNLDALSLLEEYGGLNETDRESFDAKLQGQNLDEGIYVSLLAAYDAWSAYGDGAIAAWDLSRVGTIMGYGYAAGYCTYEEALDKTLEAARKAKELFSSWEEFNQSYLYGYSYWAEESLEDPESSAAERAELLHGMESLENGPFSFGWDIELTKDW
nr:DUF1266 domain-containing protein [uncultured Acetatifactor sp.]